MKEPCTLHTEPLIESPSQIVTAEVPDIRQTLMATRKTVYHRYTEEIAVNGAPDVVYEGTEDILPVAQWCASTILANRCPLYVVTTNKMQAGRMKIERRETVVAHPERFTQVVSE